MPRKQKPVPRPFIARDEVQQEIVECRGRTVQSVKIITDPSYHYVAIEFEDGFEADINIHSGFQFGVQWTNVSTGDVEIIREYRKIITISNT